MAQSGLRDVDWQKKYKELKMQLVKFTDIAYQQGFQAGAMQMQQQQIQEQQVQMQQQQMEMQAQAAQMQAQAQGQPQEQAQLEQQGQEGQSPEQFQAQQEQEMAQGQEGQQEMPQGQNLVDQYVAEIENLVNKSDATDMDLKKSLLNITENLKKSKNYSDSYKYNMSDKDKKALSLQEQIVADVLKGFDRDSQGTASAIDKILKG